MIYALVTLTLLFLLIGQLRARLGALAPWLLGALNLALVVLLFFLDPVLWTPSSRAPHVVWAPLLTLLLALVAHYLLCLRRTEKEGWYDWLLILFPVSWIALAKGLAPVAASWRLGFDAALLVPGVSYVSLKASLMAFQGRLDRTWRPSLLDYGLYVLFLPTMLTGPISSYELHKEAMREAPPPAWGRAVSRLLVGAVKLLVLAAIFERGSLGALSHQAGSLTPLSFAFGAVCSYLSLYCNFAGAVDLVIGFAALAGFPLEENFDRPLAATNLVEFWSRWHMTMLNYLRSVLFTPLLMTLSRKAKGRWRGAVFAGVTLALFVTVGVWHEASTRFLVFGLMHGTGFLVCWYFGRSMRQRYGAAWESRRKGLVYRGLAWTLTFGYVALSMVFFEPECWQIIQRLRLG